MRSLSVLAVFLIGILISGCGESSFAVAERARFQRNREIAEARLQEKIPGMWARRIASDGTPDGSAKTWESEILQAATTWCAHYHRATDDCVDHANEASRRIVAHLRAVDGEAEPVQEAWIPNREKAQSDAEDCLLAFRRRNPTRFNAPKVWNCLVDSANERRLARRFNELRNRFLDDGMIVCREIHGQNSRLCGLPISAAATRLAQYHMGQVPWDLENYGQLDLALVVERCIELSRDGALVYAPAANSCIRGTIERASREAKREERLRREAGK